MYAYACFLHAHAYSKDVYACNWALHVGPLYAHVYSCLETLIRTFFASVSLFYLCNMLLPCLVLRL